MFWKTTIKVWSKYHQTTSRNYYLLSTKLRHMLSEASLLHKKRRKPSSVLMIVWWFMHIVFQWTWCFDCHFKLLSAEDANIFSHHRQAFSAWTVPGIRTLNFLDYMPTLKRPASACLFGTAAKKRPASGSIKDVVGELQAGLGDEEGEADKGELVARDKQKAQKFHKMMSQGTLPEHIVHMFNVESKKAKEGQRAYQSKLINQLFSKGADGAFRLMTDRQEFQEYRAIFHRSIAKDKTEGLPRTLMLASHFHWNETLMKKAIDNGELVSKTDPVSKIEYLEFRKLSSAEIRGSEQGERVEGMKKISKEQAHIIADVMMKLKWKFQLTKALNGWVLQTKRIGHLWVRERKSVRCCSKKSLIQRLYSTDFLILWRHSCSGFTCA